MFFAWDHEIHLKNFAACVLRYSKYNRNITGRGFFPVRYFVDENGTQLIELIHKIKLISCSKKLTCIIHGKTVSNHI